MHAISDEQPLDTALSKALDTALDMAARHAAFRVCADARMS